MATGRAELVLAALGACAARFRCWLERCAGWRARPLADRRCRELCAALPEDVRGRWLVARARLDD